MKLSARDTAQYFARPNLKSTGMLIYGSDAMRVALKRQEMIRNLIGPDGDSEMRLTRVQGAEVRRDAAMVLDGLKAQGFFPGPRVVFVEDATDTAAEAIIAALQDWQSGDAQLVVSAGALKATSKLRKAFEAHKNAYAVGIYDEPPTRQEIEAALRDAGLTSIDPAAMTDLNALTRVLDPGDFRQTVEKIGLYKFGDPTPLTSAEVAANAPTSTDADVDDILHAVAEAQVDQIGPVWRRLQSQGVNPVTLCIGATRHFRALHAACADPDGPSSGMAKLRPPVFGPRRDKMLRQAQAWGLPRLEQALGVLTDTDLTLRSTSRAPAMAVIERAMIRLAMLARK
jgi:DNA polymerase-3 subunit delta